MLADILERHKVLKALAADPKVINEDGSSVDPCLELAREYFGRKVVTFEERNAMIVYLRKAEVAREFTQKYSGVHQWSANRPLRPEDW